MAITLSEKNFGAVVDYFGGRRDLEEGIIRVLYNLSFVEDPTRILRAVRFEQRYNFKIESQTLTMAKNAIKSKMLAKLSADRVREELKHILGEPLPVRAILRMRELDIWPFILPEANIEDETVEILKRLPGALASMKAVSFDEVNSWLVYLAVLMRMTGCKAAIIDERLRLTKEEYRTLDELLCDCPDAIERISGAAPMKMSEIASVLRSLSNEGYTYILASAATDLVRERIKNYLARSRHNKLLINGEDIKKLGYRPGPDFKKALNAARDARLDGLVSSREEEIRFIQDYLARISIKEGG